ncbi:MAG: HEAT repeat domain-containing protein [Planctomycetota bacterium]|jgi:hypothetical protein
MSQTTASVLVVLVLFGLAVYIGIYPPEGFTELPYRIIFPFVLIAVGFVQLENLRMRAHMAELIGAIRTAVGRAQGGRAEPPPQVKGEAIRILMGSLKSDDPTVRQTAATQLAQLTGENHGEDMIAWENWWKKNQDRFGGNA